MVWVLICFCCGMGCGMLRCVLLLHFLTWLRKSAQPYINPARFRKSDLPYVELETEIKPTRTKTFRKSAQPYIEPDTFRSTPNYFEMRAAIPSSLEVTLLNLTWRAKFLGKIQLWNEACWVCCSALPVGGGEFSIGLRVLRVSCLMLETAVYCWLLVVGFLVLGAQY